MFSSRLEERRRRCIDTERWECKHTHTHTHTPAHTHTHTLTHPHARTHARTHTRGVGEREGEEPANVKSATTTSHDFPLDSHNKSPQQPESCVRSLVRNAILKMCFDIVSRLNNKLSKSCCFICLCYWAYGVCQYSITNGELNLKFMPTINQQHATSFILSPQPSERCGVQHLAQGHFRMQDGGTRDQTTSLLVSGQPAQPPRPQPPPTIMTERLNHILYSNKMNWLSLLSMWYDMIKPVNVLL